MNSLPLRCLAWLVAFWMSTGMLVARPAHAHPMGNFSINHLARFRAGSQVLSLRYILDFAEIPTAERMPQLDKNGDNLISANEKSSYVKTQGPAFLSGLSLLVNGRKIALSALNSDLEVRAGAGGLPTLRVWFDSQISLPKTGVTRVVYEDGNFAGRTGWMEIVAVADKGRSILNSNAASIDSSRGLTAFPIDAGIVPPRRNSATFSIAATGGAVSENASKNTKVLNPKSDPKIEAAGSDAVPVANNQTPQNRFTQAIAERNLTPGLVMGGLLFAFLFGAVHALSPGHGKTMVAAYLVGTRGTPRHAFLLGLVVTITHTFGVFALGLALLFASRYIVPERLFPALSALSGLLIFGVGLWLFMSRWQGLSENHSESHSHDHSHSHGGHSHGDHFHDHVESAHLHDEPHSHSSHSHAPGVHSHGGRAHSHAVPDGPVTMKTLVALGISGGIVPCPEALVVLLAAVKLHRIGYGMLLISAFSVGLAAALIAIGLLVVSARQHLSRFDKLGEGSALVRYLPLGSAALITLIGAALTLRAAVGTP